MKEVGREKMSTERKRDSAEFKARVAVDAIKGHKTVNELASIYGVHPHRRELKVIPYACPLHAASCSRAGNTSARPVSQARMVVA